MGILTMMSTNSFADKVEATVGCRAGEGAVEVGELTRTEFSVGAGGEFVVMPVEGLDGLS